MHSALAQAWICPNVKQYHKFIIMNKRQLLALTVILTVFVIKLCSEKVNMFLWNDKEAPNFYWSILGQVAYYLIPAIAVLVIFHGPKKVPAELGLSNNFLQGLLYAFLFTLPMLIGYCWMGHYNTNHSLVKNIVFAFKDGFREEIFYRAFLFGQLFRQAKWGFLPAVVINGLIFGFSHLYQAHSLSESIGIFAITFAGAIWFAWLFIEWNENIWLPVLMHFFMNFYWDVFSTEQTALGGLMLNVPRIVTIALSVYVTIKISRGKGGLKINRTNFIRQKI
jgi:membrane protease YdiL (CAAX protease family)